MRVIFMGTPSFATPTLTKLIESSHEVVGVVTRADKPVGRGKKLSSPPVKLLAAEHQIPVLQPERIRGNDFYEQLAGWRPDAIVVVAYGRIIPPAILKLPRFGCINVHASLLPKFRGAAPIQWSIVRGERTTGVTVMQMDEGLDTGNIIATEEVPILDDEDAVSLANMLSMTGADLLVRVLDEIEAKGRVDSTPQDEAQATQAPLLKKSDGLIDWSQTNEEIILRMRGLQPWPTAFSFLHGRVWKFFNAEPFEDPDGLVFPKPSGPEAKYQYDIDPGTVSALIKGRGFTVKTGDGHLLIKQVRPAGKRPMSAQDAVNGKLVVKGDEFISDPAFLEGTDEVE